MRDKVLNKVKEIIKNNYRTYCLGLFFTRNTVGDYTNTIYEDEDVTIDVCDYWQYFEVFGLTEDEETEIEDYYNKLCSRRKP